MIDILLADLGLNVIFGIFLFPERLSGIASFELKTIILHEYLDILDNSKLD